MRRSPDVHHRRQRAPSRSRRFRGAGSHPRGGANDVGSHENYFVGLRSLEGRNFFVFDLAGITDVIVSASLVLNFGLNGSPQGTETYTLFDVNTSPDALLNGSGGSAAFDDLGSGKSYASQMVSTGQPAYSTLTMLLNQDAIADLLSALGTRFVIGGAITTINGTAGQYLFGGTSGSFVTQLVLETEPAAPTAVPEPATRTLLGAGLIAIAGRARRRKH